MDPTAPDPTDPVANVDPAVVAERERTSTILQAVRAAKLEQTFADRLIAEGVPVDKARVAILGELARRDEEMHIDNHTRFDDSGSREAGARRVQLMAEALAARFGGPKPSDRAEQYLRMSVVDMARHSLELRGMSTRLLSRGQLIARGLHSTSDFPVLLTETGNRMLRHGYASYQGGVRQICRQSSAPDFRAKSLLMLGEAPELRKVNEHGEFTRGSMASSKESYALATFGRVFGITRQALVNDDLGAFTDLAARLGRSAAEFVASQLVTLLTSNPAMSDGVALFAAPHANLGTAAVISVASLGEALKLMRLQKGLDRKTPIDVTPRFIVVPAALEVVARQHVAQINATKPGDTNPFTSANLEVVVDPRLDADSDTAWYLAADPSAFDTIEFSFLDGNEGPELESRAGFDVDGLEVRVRLDFGAGVIDHRGLVKNAGA